jgi:gamma-glutamylputrescine oxidase
LRQADPRGEDSEGERNIRSQISAQCIYRHDLEWTFPQLQGRKLDFAWGGLVSVTTSRLPQIGRIDDIFFAHSYSGLGVLLSSSTGKVLVDALSGDRARWIYPPP